MGPALTSHKEVRVQIAHSDDLLFGPHQGIWENPNSSVSISGQLSKHWVFRSASYYGSNSCSQNWLQKGLTHAQGRQRDSKRGAILVRKSELQFHKKMNFRNNIWYNFLNLCKLQILVPTQIVSDLTDQVKKIGRFLKICQVNTTHPPFRELQVFLRLNTKMFSNFFQWFIFLFQQKNNETAR